MATQSLAHRNTYGKTPIYLNGKTIGFVQAGTFHKTIDGSKHMLRRPAAIAYDSSVIHSATAEGANRLSVYDISTRLTYTAAIDRLLEHGFAVNRGFGAQVALVLDWWSVNGEPAVNDRRAAQSNKEILELQLGLFGEVAR